MLEQQVDVFLLFGGHVAEELANGRVLSMFGNFAVKGFATLLKKQGLSDDFERTLCAHFSSWYLCLLITTIQITRKKATGLL